MRNRSSGLISLILLVQLTGCGGGSSSDPAGWPIARDVFTTTEQQALPANVPSDAPHINPGDVAQYAQYGYSAWTTGGGMSYVPRTELAPGHTGAPGDARLLSFFSMSDIHIADKESPAQVNYIGLMMGYGSGGSSAYSPVILSATQVLDAAVQTINVLHQRSPFDFGISLGDDCNNTQYNELRWFIDVMDGQDITPSSGSHAGADTIDYQRPYKAAGLNKSIPWYQVIGNHDQFWMGSAFEVAKLQAAHVADTIIDIEPVVPATPQSVEGTGAYMGVVDGSTPYGDIIGAGPDKDFPEPPRVVADSNRHSLSTPESTTLNWMTEFFNTTSNPVGHGFTQANLGNDFSCYSFEPKAELPLKVIVLDDTCKGQGNGSTSQHSGYAMGCLDQQRLQWLENELQEGQDNDKLMIIAAHVPVYPQVSITNASENEPVFFSASVVNDAELVAILHRYPNLIMWMAGHRHVNVVTPHPFNRANLSDHPEQSFWEVETPSLRDFPQQFRTFDIRRNSDNTISIIVTDVDPAVADGSPAAKSRDYAIGAARVYLTYPLTDTGSQVYNAELVKQLTPKMQAKIAGLGSPVN